MLNYIVSFLIIGFIINVIPITNLTMIMSNKTCENKKFFIIIIVIDIIINFIITGLLIFLNL